MQPDAKLAIPPALWQELLKSLHARTRGRHESGAFLLGTKASDHRRVQHIVYYDELDPAAYRTGVCILHAKSFGPLWELCRARGLSVVADIHVHPLQAWQSEADRRNPMIAQTGHLALILPWFARPPVKLEEMGFFEYLGSHQWRDLSGRKIAQRLVFNA
jgi:proteasome lid subunit RPN8/RPN11